MKVLVTGGEGFTGLHLVRALAARGDAVTSLDVSPGDPRDVDPLALRGVRLVRGSVDDERLLASLVPGHELVFQLAYCEAKVAAEAVSEEFVARGMDILIGDESYVTLNELVHLIGQVLGTNVRIYRPKVSLREGLERTMRWYRERGLLAQSPTATQRSLVQGVAR